MLGTRAPSQSFDEPPGPNGSAPPAEAGLSVGLREEGSSSADGGDGAAASGGSS
jgi:hypothetical protein